MISMNPPYKTTAINLVEVLEKNYGKRVSNNNLSRKRKNEERRRKRQNLRHTQQAFADCIETLARVGDPLTLLTNFNRGYERTES